MNSTPVLRVSQLTKSFGTLSAVAGVEFQVMPAEVVGLAGHSGAGKSVLIRTISGLLEPDQGKLEFAGQQMQWPFHAQNLGMGIIYQEPALADQFDVVSNIFLGHELFTSWWSRLLRLPDHDRMARSAAELLASLDMRLPSLDEKVGALSSEQRHLIAIAQVMARRCQLVIVDDLSQQLSFPIQRRVLRQIRSWQQQGTAVLFSNQNLDHLFAVADRILVLRQGTIVANFRTDETSREEVVAAMVGTTMRQQRTPVIWAIDSYYQARQQAETLRHNQTMLQRNLAAKDSINRQLVDQLNVQVEALDSANLALQDAQRRLLTEREEERKHLARELHDQLIQDLLGLNYHLEELGFRASAETSPFTSEIVEVREQIRSLIDDLRRICGALRPPTIDSLGLVSALHSYAQAWSERTGIESTLDMSRDIGRLPEAIELSIFRIVQEGLNNTWKHSGATSVEIVLKQTSPRLLLIAIADNGTGLEDDFDLSMLGQDGHFGLLGISERVALMGGRLDFQNQPEGGLLLLVEIPHPRTMQSKSRRAPG